MSLRARLLVGLGVIALVLVAASVLITRATESYLIERVDAQLRSAGPPLRENPGFPDASRAFSSAWVGLVADDGTVTTLVEPRIGSATDLPVIDASTALDAAGQSRSKPFTVGSAGDTRYRVLVFHDFRSTRTLLVGLPLNDVDAAVTRLITIEVAATLTTLALLALVAWWVIRLGVRPIKQMTATATAIAEGDLSHRVPEGAAGTEAGELGTALNAMLGRIEASFDERDATEARLRRFAADASHELRTPVTTIRGYAELYRTGALGAPEALDNALHRTEQEAIRMGALIDDLLLLARLDQARPLHRAPVDLGALARDAVADASATDPSRTIGASSTGDTTVSGDDHRLRQVITNLLGNALVHTPAGTPVEVRVEAGDDDVVVEVVDHGPGMNADVAAQAFERFYRADPSRTRASGGAGLGLSIVDAIVGAHGGDVAIAATAGGGTTVRVRLPRAAPQQP